MIFNGKRFVLLHDVGATYAEQYFFIKKELKPNFHKRDRLVNLLVLK